MTGRNRRNAPNAATSTTAEVSESITTITPSGAKMQFNVEDKPSDAVRGRAAGENPFIDAVKNVVKMMDAQPGKALSFMTTPDVLTVQMSQLQRAGRDQGVSIRVVITEDGERIKQNKESFAALKGGPVKVSFYAAEKVSRPRKSKANTDAIEQAAQEPASEPANDTTSETTSDTVSEPATDAAPTAE